MQAPPGEGNLRLGSEVALGFAGASFVLAGAPGHPTGGSLYQFDRAPGGWFGSGTWEGHGNTPGDNMAVHANGADAAWAYRSDTADSEVRNAPGGADPKLLIDQIDGFPSAVAISGDVIAVGLASHNVGSGRVLVYRYNTEFDIWLADAPIGGSFGSRLGASLALSPDGTVLVVGAPGAGDNGEVRVYVHDATVWTLYQTITPPEIFDGTTDSEFGAALDIEDSWLLVGAPDYGVGAYTDLGWVGLYDIEFPGFYGLQQTSSFEQVGAHYGAAISVASHGSRLFAAIGAPGGDLFNEPNARAGVVITKQLESGETSWSTQHFLHDSVHESGAMLGTAVATDGVHVVAGAPGMDGILGGEFPSPDAGGVLVFEYVGVELFVDGFESGDTSEWQ